MVSVPAEVSLDHQAFPLVEDAVLTCDETGRHRVRYRFELPYFAPFWRPLLERRARLIETAADSGQPIPSNLPWWAPPAPQSLSTSAMVACICLLSGVWSYGGGTGGLLTQTLPYAADRYDVGQSALGVGLAAVRLGILLALVLGLVADRVGRRRFIVVASVTHCVLTALVGLAPTFETYVAGHVALRCLDVALSVALGVLAAELVPAGNRAITLSLVLLANGVGLALAVASLPIAAAGDAGFTTVYLLQLLAIPLVLDAARRLNESPRYLAHAREPHRYRELLGRTYRGRLAMVGGAAMLGAAFVVPTSEFFNLYLDAHGFNAFEIVFFLACTGAPSFAMLVVGGRLADLRSRKRVGVPLILAGTSSYAAFFLVDGIWLWPTAFGGAMLSSAGGAALLPFRIELFPTRVRSAASIVVLAATVIGSVAGLGVVALLADPLGLGPAIAVLAVGPAVGVLVVALGLPETARRELEDTSLEQN